MKIEFWLTGKTIFPYLEEGIVLYEKRLKRYLTYQTILLPEVKNGKNLPPELLKEKEGEVILSKLAKEDTLVLLDEKGKQFSSVEFSGWMQQRLVSGQKKMVFVVGGAWGFSKAVYERSDFQLSLSKMTFSHQMIRLFFLEQLYRAMTILKGEPYHNE
jgi:23S rRNA (pseudouridine1915-N3)-methyltransferase